jgi:hypothetical protein
MIYPATLRKRLTDSFGNYTGETSCSPILQSLFGVELTKIIKWKKDRKGFEDLKNSSIRFLKLPKNLKSENDPLKRFIKENMALAVAIQARLFRFRNIIYDLMLGSFDGSIYVEELFKKAGVLLNEDTFCDDYRHSNGKIVQERPRRGYTWDQFVRLFEFDKQNPLQKLTFDERRSRGYIKILKLWPWSVAQLIHRSNYMILEESSKYRVLLYLISQPTSNSYSDSYGQSFKNNLMEFMVGEKDLLKDFEYIKQILLKIFDQCHDEAYVSFCRLLCQRKVRDPYSWIKLFSEIGIDFNQHFKGDTTLFQHVSDECSTYYSDSSTRKLYFSMFEFLASLAPIKSLDLPCISNVYQNETNRYLFYYGEYIKVPHELRCPIRYCKLPIYDCTQTYQQKMAQILHSNGNDLDIDSFKDLVKIGTKTNFCFYTHIYFDGHYDSRPRNCQCDSSIHGMSFIHRYYLCLVMNRNFPNLPRDILDSMFAFC